METTVLIKQLLSGGTLTVTLREYLPGQHIAVAHRDGKRVATGSVCMLRRSQGEITHYIGAGKAAVGLTTTEATTIRDAIDAADRAWNMTEAGHAMAAEREREDLVAEIQGAEDDLRAARARAFEHDTGAGWNELPAFEAAVRTARARLVAFDAARTKVAQ